MICFHNLLGSLVFLIITVTRGDLDSDNRKVNHKKEYSSNKYISLICIQNIYTLIFQYVNYINN